MLPDTQDSRRDLWAKAAAAAGATVTATDDVKTLMVKLLTALLP